ncbi:MAG: DUF1631 family protein [Parasulfuritortus sp.]|nr:DUF1631 family protein [Parasulfuritortus sp.]
MSDFCQQGFNLQPIDPNSALDITARHAPDETISIELPASGKDKEHRTLHGKLTHTSATDLGVNLLEDTPADVFQTMVEARSKLPHQNSEENQLFPEESQAILRDCVNLFRLFLGKVWQDLLSDIKVKIAERDTAHLPLNEQSRYLNSLTDLQIRVDEVSQLHFDMLIERMHKIGEIEANAAPMGSPELSILDEGSFEDWLNISGVFNRIDIDNRQAMYQFAQRFSRLTPTPIGPHNDPFGPQAVCLTFQEALRELDFNNGMRAILYRQLGEILGTRYAPFYDDLNRLLAPLKPVRIQPEKSSKQHVKREAVETGDIPALATDSEQGSVVQQVSRLAEIAEKLFNLYPPMAEAALSKGHTQSDSPNAFPGTAAQLEQLQQILARLSDTQDNQKNVPTSPASAGSPITAAQRPSAGITSSQIENLLARLGATQAVMPDATLTDRVSRALTRPEAAAHVSPPVREELGMMANLLSHALTDHGGQSDIDLLLKKLEQPIYDIALRGEAPARLENHPLGQLINLVDRFAIVADDGGRLHDPQLRALIESIIDKGLSDGSNLEATCTTLDKLLKYPIRTRKQRVDGYQEICEAKGRIRDSKQFVVEALNQRLGGQTIPAVITRLLEHGWQHRLVLVKLRDDKNEWERSWQVLGDLMVKPETPQLLDEIQSGLEKVSIDSQQLDHLLKELAIYLHAPDQSEQVRIPMGWFKIADAPSDSALQPDQTLSSQLRIGDWWDIEHDGKPIPMQLIWLSQPPGRTCFVNRSADRKQELGLTELSVLRERGAAKPGEDHDLPLLERSEYGTIDAMYRRLVQQANRDPVTNLPNRKHLIHHSSQGAQLNSINSFCVLGFEPYRLIYDHCGIEAGETLARTLAGMAERSLGTNHRLAAIGEGLFAVFLPGLGIDAARDFTARLTRNFDGFRFQHGGDNFNIQVFFGLASYQPGILDADEALRQAVSACEAARSSGPNTVQVYTDSNRIIQDQETMDSWAGQISEMLASDRLFLRCQKIAPLHAVDELPYYEVLLGVLDPKGNQVNPQPFVLAVERWNRAYELDLWVFKGVMDWIRNNRADFDRTGGFSVNLSAQSLSNQELLATLHRELSTGDIPCEKIAFEITETATLKNQAVAQDFMRQIRRYGCRFSLDDFGSGNASFSYLRSLRTDTLKIDGAYIKDMVGDPELQAMVKSMNEIGHALGMKTVAEFVASPEILALVREIGVDYAQGYEVEKPTHINGLLLNS